MKMREIIIAVFNLGRNRVPLLNGILSGNSTSDIKRSTNKSPIFIEKKYFIINRIKEIIKTTVIAFTAFFIQKILLFNFISYSPYSFYYIGVF